jgi:hypothetical protein
VRIVEVDESLLANINSPAALGETGGDQGTP